MKLGHQVSDHGVHVSVIRTYGVFVGHRRWQFIWLERRTSPEVAIAGSCLLFSSVCFLQTMLLPLLCHKSGTEQRSEKNCHHRTCLSLILLPLVRDTGQCCLKAH